MSLKNDGTPIADQIIKTAGDFLSNRDPRPLSHAAFDVLQGKIGQYVTDLIRESFSIARQEQVDVVSAKHVEAACDRLSISAQQRWVRKLEVMGGLCFGAGVSSLGSMFLLEDVPTLGWVFTICTLVAGASMLGPVLWKR